MRAALDQSVVGARLGLCVAALAGSAAAVSDARADIIEIRTPIALPDTVAGVYIDLITGASGTSPLASPGWDFNPWASNGALVFFWNGTPASTAGGVASTTTGPYADLGSGSVVGPMSTFITSTLPSATAVFQATGTHVLGFRFFNESTAAINYGYMAISTTGPMGFPAAIISWTYDNSGAAISVDLTPHPAVPEPSTSATLSIGALALGAAGMRRHRRQRRTQRV